jgi:CBS domain-containing protein
VITAQEVEGSMRENALDATAGSLAHRLPTLMPDESLEKALTLLMRQEVSGLPVVTQAGNRVIGWLTHRDVLRAYAARLGEEVATAESGGPGVSPRADLPSRLRDYRVVDLEMHPGAAPIGHRISDLAWPAFSLPIAVRREGRSFRPGPPTVVEPGDRLTVLVPFDLVDHIGELLEVGAEGAPTDTVPEGAGGGSEAPDEPGAGVPDVSPAGGVPDVSPAGGVPDVSPAGGVPDVSPGADGPTGPPDA